MFKLPFLKCLSVIKYLYTGWSISREIWEDTFCKHKIHSTWNVGGMIQLRLHLCFGVELELKLGFLRWCVLSLFFVGWLWHWFCVWWVLCVYESSSVVFSVLHFLIARHSECLIPVDVGRQLETTWQLWTTWDASWLDMNLKDFGIFPPFCLLKAGAMLSNTADRIHF